MPAMSARSVLSYIVIGVELTVMLNLFQHEPENWCRF